MKLPWSRQPEPLEYADEPVSHAEALEPGDWVRQTPIEWAPKPPDLLAALQQTYAASTQDEPTVSRRRSCEGVGTLEWTDALPTEAGLYWWRDPEPEHRPSLGGVHLALLVNYGGRLSAMVRTPDGERYTSASLLERQWAGPLELPPGLDLERDWGDMHLLSDIPRRVLQTVFRA
jgi:hypothetical protein